MKITIFIIECLLIGFLFSCKRPVNYIIQIDTGKIVLDAAKENGLTVEQSQSMGVLVRDSIEKNTIGKRIPDIIITNESSKKYNLRNEISKNTIIVISDIYCGFGLDCLSNIYPKVSKKLTDNNKGNYSAPPLKSAINCLLFI